MNWDMLAVARSWLICRGLWTSILREDPFECSPVGFLYVFVSVRYIGKSKILDNAKLM